jgi:hypothetical protein
MRSLRQRAVRPTTSAVGDRLAGLHGQRRPADTVCWQREQTRGGRLGIVVGDLIQSDLAPDVSNRIAMLLGPLVNMQ